MLHPQTQQKTTITNDLLSIPFSTLFHLSHQTSFSTCVYICMRKISLKVKNIKIKYFTVIKPINLHKNG